jgi:glycosyltransferase involved in cell wall biosynthesis
MKVTFIKDWHHSVQETQDNQDGIIATLQLLNDHHDLTILTRTTSPNTFELNIHGMRWIFLSDKECPKEKGYLSGDDAYICWGSLDRPWHNLMKDVDGVKILQFAGGPTKHENEKYFDAIGCQSQVYIDAFKAQGHKNVFRSFGTNTDVFKPIPKMRKVFDAIYPASFCLHKNIEVFAKTFRSRGLVCGNWNDERIVSKAMDYETPCVRRVNSMVLNCFYNLSKVTVITCGPQGGAQRCVLESMACGTPVIVMSDHDKCVEFVEDSGFGKVCEPIREEILEAHEDLIANPQDPNLGIDYINSKWTQHVQYEAYINTIYGIISSRQ